MHLITHPCRMMACWFQPGTSTCWHVISGLALRIQGYSMKIPTCTFPRFEPQFSMWVLWLLLHGSQGPVQCRFPVLFLTLHPSFPSIHCSISKFLLSIYCVLDKEGLLVADHSEALNSSSRRWTYAPGHKWTPIYCVWKAECSDPTQCKQHGPQDAGGSQVFPGPCFGLAAWESPGKLS